MRCCLLRKVPYRSGSRLLWAVVLAQHEGLSLLFVQRTGEEQSHTLAIAVENPAEGVFEAVEASRFPLESQDLEHVGQALQALGDSLSKDEFRRMFHIED